MKTLMQDVGHRVRPSAIRQTPLWYEEGRPAKAVWGEEQISDKMRGAL